jgi:hypothetical protein
VRGATIGKKSFWVKVLSALPGVSGAHQRYKNQGLQGQIPVAGSRCRAHDLRPIDSLLRALIRAKHSGTIARMDSFSYCTSPYAIRPDLKEAYRSYWSDLASAGSWWTGTKRIPVDGLIGTLTGSIADDLNLRRVGSAQNTPQPSLLQKLAGIPIRFLLRGVARAGKGYPDVPQASATRPSAESPIIVVR